LYVSERTSENALRTPEDAVFVLSIFVRFGRQGKFSNRGIKSIGVRANESRGPQKPRLVVGWAVNEQVIHKFASLCDDVIG
jgi:hypothetical protein